MAEQILVVRMQFALHSAQGFTVIAMATAALQQANLRGALYRAAFERIDPRKLRSPGAGPLAAGQCPGRIDRTTPGDRPSHRLPTGRIAGSEQPANSALARLVYDAQATDTANRAFAMQCDLELVAVRIDTQPIERQHQVRLHRG
ncbi:hypothetical protein D3C71_1665400 [compost metagenome]